MLHIFRIAKAHHLLHPVCPVAMRVRELVRRPTVGTMASHLRILWLEKHHSFCFYGNKNVLDSQIESWRWFMDQSAID